ncbi:ABC transporter permease [Clostridium sp. Marseille-QA1073]
MQIFPQIKKNLISFLREGKITIICFLLFPMIMAYIYGAMQEDMFQGKSHFEPIKVIFNCDKFSKEGEVLTAILNDKEMKSFITVVADEESQCKVTISDDFKSIDIEKLKGSDAQVDMVKEFMEIFNENINQYNIVVDNVNKLNLTSVEKGELINKLLLKLQENNKKPLIKEQLVEGYKSLGAREYYTISMFSFTSIMLVIVLIKEFYKEKKQGVVRRSFSTPNSEISYLLGYLSSCFILALIINFIYVAINIILGIAFLGNFVGNVIIIIFQSLLQTAVVGMIISFIKSEKIANSIMNIIIFIPVVIGGVFFYSDLIEIKILKFFSNISPNSLILNSYKNLSIAQEIYGAKNQIIIMAMLSLMLLIISCIRVKFSWEE